MLEKSEWSTKSGQSRQVKKTKKQNKNKTKNKKTQYSTEN